MVFFSSQTILPLETGISVKVLCRCTYAKVMVHNSSVLQIILTKERRLFHIILPLKYREFGLMRNDLAGGRNSLNPFLESYGIGFLLKFVGLALKELNLSWLSIVIPRNFTSLEQGITLPVSIKYKGAILSTQVTTN